MAIYVGFGQAEYLHRGIGVLSLSALMKAEKSLEPS